MAEETVYDVIVVGAGIVGSYTAYHARRAGKSTCLIEQFPLPHTRGSSHGQSRTIRSAYGDKEYYTKMMTKAFQMWRQLEELSNQTLFKLSDEKLRDTYPMLSFSPDIGGAVLDLSGGLILAGRALTAIQNQYRNLGGLLKDGEKMMEIIPGKMISVKTEARLYRAKRVVLCVGPWASKVLTSIGLDVPLQTQRVKVCYWKEKVKGTFSSRQFPVFSQMNAIGPYLVYGVPCEEYPELVKVCLHYGPTVDPDSRDDVDDLWVEKALQRYVREHVPGLEPWPVIKESCIYTNTPDEDYILDRHPSCSNIVIGAGFSGHGFKLAPVVGEILSKLAIGLTPEEDLSYFRLNRFTKSHL
ncbi:peroxisomal sarcosine oxidase-like isoform X3 [Argopecten irradians]|uniref:peroxisomal sarcosine oxidase-like isoform X3 n=1 Tax=Argopecten irradians TaxID=31199 RepID=UPI0037160928